LIVTRFSLRWPSSLFIETSGSREVELLQMIVVSRL